ncbi:MAG: HAMP domain-containing histidine kinase, partial [Burkholderiaceae bacterium]|nr:HAMP domain-containing histidine kinase [Burkholderiaceae bacterium]
DEFVVFLDDVREVEERAQQLKLAAMGRLTASIAHEIRNPLAAISHAGQLLSEDAREPLQARLSGIVRENTQRLNRLVDDVLRVARRESPLGDEIELGAFIREWLAEFERDRALHPGRVEVQAEPNVRVKFELSHLRQVLRMRAPPCSSRSTRRAPAAPGSACTSRASSVWPTAASWSTPAGANSTAARATDSWCASRDAPPPAPKMSASSIRFPSNEQRDERDRRPAPGHPGRTGAPLACGAGGRRRGRPARRPTCANCWR